MRDESLLARYDPAKLNAIGDAIAQTHDGFVPLDVRYEAAVAALQHIAHEWPARASDRLDRPMVSVLATTFTVTAVPPDVPNGDLFAITVEARGPGKWAVKHVRKYLSADGEWDQEPILGGCTDHWLDRHRFDFDTALRLARTAAPYVTVNGSTVDDALRLARDLRRRNSARTAPDAAPGGAPMTAPARRWRRGDQVWITAGEFREHAGEIVEDAVPGTDRVGVRIDVANIRQGDASLVSRVPVAWIQPWRRISAHHVAQLESIIAGLYPDGEVRQVRTAWLARYLLMHGASIDNDIWRRIAVKIATADDTLPGARLNLLTTVERDHLEAAIFADTQGRSTP